MAPVNQEKNTSGTREKKLTNQEYTDPSLYFYYGFATSEGWKY